MSLHSHQCDKRMFFLAKLDDCIVALMLKNVDVHEVGKGGFKVRIITVSSLVEVKEIYDPSPSPPRLYLMHAT